VAAESEVTGRCGAPGTPSRQEATTRDAGEEEVIGMRRTMSDEEAADKWWDENMTLEDAKKQLWDTLAKQNKQKKA